MCHYISASFIIIIFMFSSVFLRLIFWNYNNKFLQLLENPD
jgi:hypothetical protein